MAQAQALDGKYLLGTNAPDLSTSQLFSLFKAQDGVEKSNRTLKGPLAVRPLYLHSDQRIESLIFIILLALLTPGIGTVKSLAMSITEKLEFSRASHRAVSAADRSIA